MSTLIFSCSVKIIALVAILLGGIQAQQEEATTEFEGGIRISCIEGACTFQEECVNLESSVPGVPATNNNVNNVVVLEYSDISGDFVLEPASTCRADCSGCRGVPGSDTAGNIGGCIGSAGFIYCPETNSCIRPWEKTCPFEGGTTFVGPVDIVCSSGARCNDLSEDCEISVGSFVIGGLYLDGLIGTYSLPNGCTATCEGCYSEGNDAGEEQSEPEGSGAPRSNSSWKQGTVFLGLSTLILLSNWLTEIV